MGNHTSEYWARARYAYDGINLRKAFVEQIHYGGASGSDLYQVLELFHEKKAWVTNLRTKDCEIRNIENPLNFHRHDIPENAEFMGFEILGSYPEELTLSQWHVENTPGYISGTNSYLTYSPKCIPVRSDHFNNQTGF